MKSSSSSERTLLTYPTPGYTRLLICIVLAILAYSYLQFAPNDWLKPKDQHLGPQGIKPFAWWLVIPITVLLFSLFLGLIEGLFLVGRKMNPVKLEYDAANLYINDSKEERAIPVASIVFIRMIYGKLIFDAARSALYRYSIGFGDPYHPEEVTFTIFARAGRAFSNFNNLVKEKNPSVQVKDWANSFDGLGRLFRKKNS